jgi:hypothetical protein
MAFKDVVLSSRASPELTELYESRIKPMLADIHTMLYLPKSKCSLDAGCNLSCGLLLCSILAGLAEGCIDFNGNKHSIGNNQFEKKFILLMESFFPWKECTGKLNEKDIIITLYRQQIRHPLAHFLGGKGVINSLEPSH